MQLTHHRRHAPAARRPDRRHRHPDLSAHPELRRRALPDRLRPARPVPQPLRVTGIAGLRIGHATDAAAKTGVTVFLPTRRPSRRCMSPAARRRRRETDLLRARQHRRARRRDRALRRLRLRPRRSRRRHALARSARPRLCSRRTACADRSGGLPLRPRNGGDKSRPVADGSRIVLRSAWRPRLARQPSERPRDRLGRRRHRRNDRRPEGRLRCGRDDACRRRQVASFAAVNAVGRVTLGDYAAISGRRRSKSAASSAASASPRRCRRMPQNRLPSARSSRRPARRSRSSRPIVRSTRDEAKRLAIAAHDGIALAIYPGPHAVRRRHRLRAGDRRPANSRADAKLWQRSARRQPRRSPAPSPARFMPRRRRPLIGFRPGENTTACRNIASDIKLDPGDIGILQQAVAEVARRRFPSTSLDCLCYVRRACRARSASPPPSSQPISAASARRSRRSTRPARTGSIST